MSIDVWWPKLRQESREYLIANNGDAGPPDLVVEIAQAGGVTTTDAWWVGHSGPTGFYLSDEAIDWIDEVASGETPEPRPDDRNTTSWIAALRAAPVLVTCSTSSDIELVLECG